MKENFKSGFVTIIGRPNVGKSTLMNHLIGQKIAITSNKPQTTRNRIQTVYTDMERGQIVFLDTPGIHKAKNKLGEYMVNTAEHTLNEVDVILWLVEPSNFIGAGEQHIIEQLKKTKTPVILVINKVDTVSRDKILEFIDMEHTPKNLLIRAVKRNPSEQTLNIQQSKAAERRSKIETGLSRMTQELHIHTTLHKTMEQEES